MAKAPTLTDLASLTNETSAVNNINNNNTAIETAFANTLSRDGSTPNTMLADFDMNGYKILNLPSPTVDADLVTKGYGDANYGGAAGIRAEEAADLAEDYRDQAEDFAGDAEVEADRAEVAADRAEAAPERMIATSTSFNTLGVGTKTYTVDADDKLFIPGMFVIAVPTGGGGSVYNHGPVVSYSGTELVINSTNFGGSGTINDWTISVSGTRGTQGPTGPAGSGSGDMVASNNLSDLDDIPTAVSNLGLTIGADVQGYDVALEAIAATTPSAGKLIEYTGSNSAQLIDVTAAGKALLDDASASAQRTTLGLGTMAQEAATSYQPINPRKLNFTGFPITPTTSADIVVYEGGTAGVGNIPNPTGTAVDGQVLLFRFRDGSGALTLSYGSQYRAVGGASLITDPEEDELIYFIAVWNITDSKWDVLLSVREPV